MSKYSIATILLCLVHFTMAQSTFTVTNTNDAGAGSLRQAILDAEASPGADIINIPAGTITLSTGLPNITEDLTINGAGRATTIIDGNNLVRPFFIGGTLQSSTDIPVVNINNLTVQNGLAQGSSVTGLIAGGGAGMGGGLFINNGNVTIDEVSFSGNQAIGGDGGDEGTFPGAGGDGPFAATGGSAGESSSSFNSIVSFPGNGGYGAGGGGGAGSFQQGGTDGGNGGYGGGGGGAGGSNDNAGGSPGNGGSFGGNGGVAIHPFLTSGGGGGGGGLGGAIFARDGTLTATNVSFSNNSATGGAGGTGGFAGSGSNGQGRGGAIFSDGGTVNVTFFTFSGNTASSANPDTFGSVNLITAVNITAQPTDQLNIDEGIDTSFEVTAEGTIGTYQWQVDEGSGFIDIVDDANYSGATTATLNITCVPRAFNSFPYRVQIGGTLNDVTSDAATLTVVNVADLVATISSDDLMIQCEGEELTFSAVTENVTSPALQWLLNGTPVLNETTTTFTSSVSEGDMVSIELSDPTSCFPRPTIISNVLLVERIAVDTVVIANALTGTSDVGSLPYHLDQLSNLPCDDIITVMDLRQLPDGTVLEIERRLDASSSVHLIGKGSDQITIRVTERIPRISNAAFGDFHRIEGIRFEDVSGFDTNGIRTTGDSLVLRDVVVTGFGTNSGQAISVNSLEDYYVDIDGVQVLDNHRGIRVDAQNFSGPEVPAPTGTIRIKNSVFKNTAFTTINLNLSTDYDEILIEGNLFQDNDEDALIANFSVDGDGSVTIQNNSVINQFREGFRISASNDVVEIPAVRVVNNTFSETGIRGFNADPVFAKNGALNFGNLNADVINNTIVGGHYVMRTSGTNEIRVANNIALENLNGILEQNSTNTYTGSGNNIGIDLGDNNDLISTTLEVLQSLTLTDPGGNGLLVYEPVECGPAIDLANETLAPQFDQIGRFRLDASIGAVEGLMEVEELSVEIESDPFPFPGNATFAPTPDPVAQPPLRTYSYQWYLNDSPATTDEMYSATGLVTGDEVRVEATSSKTLCVRPIVASNTITIGEGITVTPTSLPENLAIGDVATRLALDPDPNLPFDVAFDLVSGAGDTDNGLFTFDQFATGGPALILANPLDFETNPSLSVRLSVFDGTNTYEQAVSIAVSDVNDAPVFTSTPTTLLERGDPFQYDMVTSDDEGTNVGIYVTNTLPDWLTFNQTSAPDEDIIASTVRTGIPSGARDLVVDEGGNIYVADFNARSIKKIDPFGNETVIADQTTSPVYVVGPYALDMAPDGTIYVADLSQDAILKIVNDEISVFVTGLQDVQDVVAQNNEVLFVIAETSKIYRIENGVPTLFAGTGTRTQVDGPFGVGTMANPNSIDVDLQGRVWLQDGGDIRIISPEGTIETIDPVISYEAGTLNARTPPFTFAAGTYTGYQSFSDIEVDAFGNVHISRGGVITRLLSGNTTSGEELTGNVFFGNETVDGNKNDAVFGRIDGMFFASDGSLYTIGSSTGSSSADNVIRRVAIPTPTFSLTGTATIAGEFPVELRATDGITSTSQDFTIKVQGPLRFEADPVTAAVEGAQYIYNPSAMHTQSTAFTYGFTLPDWLDTSFPFVPTSFLNISSGVAGIAPFAGANATVTDEAVYTIQGSTISGIRFDGSMDITIDFSSLNPIAGFEGPVITSNENGELYFAIKVGEDVNSSDQDKLIKVDPSADPISFTDLGTFLDIKDIDIYENEVIILEQRIENSFPVGDISIVDDAGMVTSVISGSGAEGLNVGLDGKIYFVGGSNFLPDDHTEFMAELALNGTFTTRDIFVEEEVYSVQDLVVDAFGNAYVHYEGLDENQNIIDSYFFNSSGLGGFPVFTAPNDINTFEISAFTRFGTTNDIFYITNNTTTGTSDLMVYSDNQIVFGTPGATDGGVNPVVITLDDQSEVVTLAYDITVAFENDAPTGLEISGNSIDENNATATSLLTFNTLDPDGSGDTFTYTLVAGTGDTDNSDFTIVDDGLQATISYDAEANPGEKSIRVRSTDAADEFVEETFTIAINDINEAPTAIALSGNMEVAENLEVGTVVGTLSTTDEDAGDIQTYSLSGTGSDLFQVVGNELQTAASLDFEQATSYTLTITSEDEGQLTIDEDFTITIIDDAPTDITLSNSSVDEGLLQGAIVGTFMTTDSDPSNTFTYDFVAGTNFNAFFEIDGDVLKTKVIFNASQFTSALIRVKTTDAIGEAFEKDLTITINDLVNSAPQLLNAPATTATQGQLYIFGPGGFDFDGDDLTYTSSGSDWLTQQDQPATVEELLAQNGANDLVIDEDDNLYITINDGNGTATNILKYDEDTEMTSTLLSMDATSISFVEVDENGVVYFSDNNFQGSSFHLKKIDNGTVSNVYSGTGDIIAGGYHPAGYMVLVESQGDNTRDIIRVDLDGTNKTTLEEEVGYISVLEIGADNNIHYTTSNEMSAIDIIGNAATSIQPQLTTDNQNSPFLYYITDFVQYSETEAYIMYADNDNAGGSLDYLVKVTSGGEQLLWRGDVIYEGGKIAANTGSKVYFARDADSDGSNSVAVWNNAFTFFFGTPEDSDVGTSTFDLTLSDGTASNDYSFAIEVANINDAPTAIVLSSMSIEENNDTGVALATLTTSDLDNDSGDTHTYALVAGEGDTDNANFEIEGNELNALVAFDHESNTSRFIRIETTDAEGDTFEETFEISIADQNEAPTAILLSGTTIDENEAAGTFIATLSTEDPDVTNDDLSFEIVDGSAFVQLTGTTLQSATSFDFETTPSFTVTIRANDGVENSSTFFSLEETFTITVGDVSESPTDIALSNASVAENSEIGTTVGTLSAQDPDGDGASTFSLVEGAEDNDLFDVADDQLTTAAVFNFEEETSYVVQVQVNDGNGNLYTENFTITITEVNEAPVFVTDNEASVSENTTSIVTISATDEDAGASLSYSIIGGVDQDLFTLSDQALSFAIAQDFESPADADGDNVYEVIVQVTDNTNEAELALSITVTDQNETPVFTSSSEFSISENATAVTTLVATDEDAGASLSYSIIGGVDQDLFTLSDQALSFVIAPDFESPEDADGDNVYEVTVQVTDNTNETELTLFVTITDQNETPVFTSSSEFSISENATAVTTLVATDEDAGASLSYSIIGGVDQTFFTLSDQALSFAIAQDFESPADADGDNVYEVIVQVTDNTNETELTLSITVTDQNETPVFTSNSEFSISENATAVTTLVATDEDAGASLSYSIIGGVDQDLFMLSDQALSFVIAPDFESPTDADGDNLYEVTVQVSDGTNATELTLSVTVTDVNEAPDLTSGTSLSIVENTTTPITLIADDSDADATLTYSIVDGPDQQALSVSANEISFVNTPDFEAPADADEDNVYAFTLRISDGTNEADSDFTITVTNANEAPTAITLSNTSVDENAEAGTVVGTLTSTDTDAAFTHTYSLSDSESNFVIAGNELQTSEVFDFEEQNSYEVTVTVSDEGSLTFEQNFTITINDLDETKANSSVVISAIDDVTVGAAAFELTATTDPENAPIIWSVEEGDATIDGTTLTPGTQSGLVVVKAVIEASDELNGSEDTESFNLIDPSLIDPIIEITLPEEAATNETVTVEVSLNTAGATTISEADIVLGIESGPGSLTGNQLTFTGSGTVVVSATLAATSETNAVSSMAELLVFEVYNIAGSALDSDGNAFFTGIAFLVSSENFNETFNVVLDLDGTFMFENIREGEYFMGIGVPQSETTYLTTYLGDKSPVLNPTEFPETMKLTADVSGLVINMQSKPASAVELLDPVTGGSIEFQAQGAADGQNRIVLGRVEMGDPIPNTQVVLSTVAGAYIADGLTDEEGFITFDGLPTGDYKIGVEIPGVGRVETEIPVEEGRQADVTGLISEDGTVALEVEEVLNVDLEAKKALTIYPNPVLERLNISIENDYRGYLNLQVFDLNGRLVHEFTHEKKFQKAEVTELLEIPGGLYVIMITGKELNLQQRFIKR